MLRPLIEIDEELCNGCGKCITDCAEGALKIVDGKARLISDVYCDGLGACLDCPQNALKLVIREAQPFDEEAALAAKAQREKKLQPLTPASSLAKESLKAKLPSWPIQLELLPAKASFLENARLLLAAHCSAFALPNFQQDCLKGKIPIIACPKLEEDEKLIKKLSNIIRNNKPASIEILRMSVPCCGGLERIAKKAIEDAGSSLVPEINIVQL